MSYTSFKEDPQATAAVRQLAKERHKAGTPGALSGQLPRLLDQIQGEAGLFAPILAEWALNQTAGDVAQAVGLLRAWAAVLPRMDTPTLGEEDLRVVRRLTPIFRNPEHGQYLGASPDHGPRMLLTDDVPDVELPDELSAARHPVRDEPRVAETDAAGAQGPLRFPRAVADLEASGVIKPGPAHSASRSALLSALAQGDTGTLTAVAYAAQRSFGNQREPLMGELRSGYAPVQIIHPDLGVQITLGEVPICTTELVVEVRPLPDKQSAPAGMFYLGAGTTIGHLERRSISAALLDATCNRDNVADDVGLGMLADAELLAPLLDGAAASGYIDHLKLPHHVQFDAKLDQTLSDHDFVEDQQE